MNEKQIQEVMALVDEFGDSRRRQGNDEYSPESANRRYAAQYGKDADELRAAIERALREQVREVPDGWNPSDKPVTPERALYFMERFKREEKLLGPHEQAAVDFVIGLLSAAPTQPAQAEQPTIRIAPAHWPMASSLEGAAHDVAKSLNECGGNNLDLRHVAMLVHHAQAEQPNGLPERDTSKPAEQQGLFRKFDVRRTDGSDAPGGKHHGCEYFVLDVGHDAAAPAALAAYADAIEVTHPTLAADMRSRYGLQPKAAQQEPVAQWQKRHPLRTDGKWENTNEHDAKWWRDNSMGWEIRALYPAAAPQREPMTEEQASRFRYEWAHTASKEDSSFTAGVRYAERFHGITKKEHE